ncbi:dicarboxylate/amino acid:cation symporter [soil metagenome]
MRVLLGLALGLAAGAAVAATQRPTLLALVLVVEPIGTLWLNALRMTVVPLVVSLLVTGIAAASAAAAAGRVGGRTLLVIATFLAGAGIFSAIVTPLTLASLPIAPGTAAALRASIGSVPETPAGVPGFGEWITGIVPANPIQAAAEGAMLPLVVFSLLLGLAATRLAPERRELLLGFFRALGETMMVIVHWVLQLAPLGVFALVFPVGAGAGLAAVGALGHYVILLSGLSVIATLLLYPVTVALTGIPVGQFARALAPAQAVAFSTRSSLASLPAMLESAQTRLGLSPAISGLVLPLAVSLMRITSPITNLAAGIFAAALFGMVLSPGQIAAGAAVAVLTSLGAVGLPGQVSSIAARLPIFITLGVPLEILGIMLAVEVIPDTFMTVGNVTADVAATAIVATRSRPLEGGIAAEPATE